MATENGTSRYDWSSQNRTTQPCTSWVYSKDTFHSTLVSDLNLICDQRIFISHTNVMTMVGLMLGSIVGGPMSDTIGRKKVIVIFLCLHYVMAIGHAFVSSIAALLVLRFLVSFCSVAFFLSGFILCTEMFRPKKRTQSGMCVMMGWTMGMITMGLVAYFVREWRDLQLILICPAALLIVLQCWLLPESPRWLLHKGRHAEAVKVFKTMARINKAELPEDLLLVPCSKEKSEAKDVHPKSIPLVVFKSATLLVRLLILIYNWMASIMVYFGLVLNVGTIVEGDLHVNFLLVAVLEIVAYIACMFLLDRTGRKRLYCAGILLAGVACLATIVPLLTGTDYVWLNIILSNVGKYGATVAFAIIWLFTVELFPISMRNSGIGVCSVAGRVGGIISPYVADLHHLIDDDSIGKSLPLSVFAGVALLAGALSLFLPETSNRELPETIEEAESMKKTAQQQEQPQHDQADEVKVTNGSACLVKADHRNSTI